MRSGPEHYTRAEEILDHAVESAGAGASPLALSVALAEAQVHATLALGAATALSEGGMMPGAEFDAWAAACASQPIPAASQVEHLLYPRTAAEQLDAIFAGREDADDALIAGLARQLLAEYQRIAGEPGIEWGVRYRYTHTEHVTAYASETDARRLVGDPRTARHHSLVHRRVVRRPDEVGPWIDGEPTAGA